MHSVPAPAPTQRRVNETPALQLPPPVRRRWVLGLCAALLVVGYAVLLEPNRLVEERVEISAPRLAAALGGARIVHLADLHLVSAGGLADRLARRVNELQPALVLITGDLTGSGGLPALTAFVGKLRSRHGVYAIAGDADAEIPLSALKHAVAAGGGRLLVEEGETVALAGGRVHLVGSGGGSPQAALIGHAPPDAAVLLLVPDLGLALAPREQALHLSVERWPGEGYLKWRWTQGSKWAEPGRPFSFERSGRQRMRLQRGQHGMLIDELQLVPDGGGPVTRLHYDPRRSDDLLGTYSWRTGEWGAEHSAVLADWPAGDPLDVDRALSAPRRRAWLEFEAPAGIRFTLRARVRCHARGNGSAFVQFDGAVDAQGGPLYRVGRPVSPLGPPGAVDLILTGGTHGGQIYLPWLSERLFGVSLPAGGRLLRGLGHVNGTPVYLTRGVGTAHVPARLFAPPEISVLQATP